MKKCLQRLLTTVLLLTLERTRGGKAPTPPPPIKFFLNFSETNYHLHLPFSVAVCISLTHVLMQDWWASVAMVTRYDIISSSWWSHFWRKMRDFSLFGPEKYKMWTKSGKMFNYVTFLMTSKKGINFLLFLSNSQFWWNPRWRPHLMTLKAPSGAAPHNIYLIL